MKLLFLFGTRPEAIKMAPVILEARRRPGIETVVVSTGQHREMLAPVLALFEIAADEDLALMRENQTLVDLVARAVERLGDAMARHAPDAVFVQGDTATAMAGALAAFFQGIPVAHVEAGLRTHNLASPYPEEANRRLIGQVTRWHLAPTQEAAANLRAEGLPPRATANGCIVVTGNTGIDALHLVRERVRSDPPQSEDLAAMKEWKAAQVGRRVVLVTGHRRENFGAPFEAFCLGLRDLAEAHPECLLVYPVHLNPNVRAPVGELLGGRENIRLAPPADYPVFVAMMDAADLVITDSGGVQEEAPALSKPVLVTRRETERPEAVAAGGVLLVGPDRAAIAGEAHRLLSDPVAYAQMAVSRSPYGDGHAAPRCLDAVVYAMD